MSFRALRVFLIVASVLAVPHLLAQTQSDVAVSKTGPASTTAGANVDWDVFVTNVGPDDAGVVTLTDDVPAGMTFVSATQNSGPTFTCTTPAVGGTGTISCSVPAMLVGESADFTFTMQVDPSAMPGATFINTATVSTANDPTDENNSSVAGTAIPPNDADLAVTKNGPSTASPNTDVTYTITVVNSGPSAANTVSLTDTLPGDMTFVSLNQNGGPAFSCSTPALGSGGTITCTIDPFAAGSSASFTLVGHIPGTASSGATYSNTAAVTSANDPTPENDSAITELTVSSVDLSVTKSGPATATAGQQISYTIAAANAGPDTAQQVQIDDVLPSGTTFASINQNTGPAFICTGPAPGFNGIVTCSITAFASSASATFTLTVNVDNTFIDGATLTNTATVSSQSNDTNPSNDSSSTTATITGVTDLSVTKTGPASANAGANISWTITLQNLGVNTAANTQLSDTLPGGMTFVSMQQTGGPAFNCSGTSTVTCTNASFAAGATATFTLVASTAGSATGSVSNTAVVSTTTPDTNAANNSSTATTTLTASADLAVTKSGPTTAVQNQDVAYTIGVTNNGPSDAQSVTLSDAIPSQATFVSMNQNTGPAFNCSGTTTVTCTIATLASGASATFTLTVHTNAAVSGGMVNTANVSATTSDPNAANNSASAATNIVTADVAITKNGSPATVAAGGNVTWTIVVTNNGPGDATNVTMTDALLANTTFVSLNQSGVAFSCTTPAVATNGTVTCSTATLVNGASTTFTLVAKTAQATPPGTLSNTANVTSSSPLDPTPANNAATSSTTITLIDLSLTKTVSNGPYVAGQPVTFTLTVTNNGTAQADNVVVTDVLPAGMSATSTTPVGACTGTTTVTCTAATLAAGASTAFTITANLPSLQGNYSNTATVTSANGESAPANNTSSAAFAVVPATAIPTLSPEVLLLLAALLGFMAVVTLKR